jgi:hypothetical protein
MRPLRSSRLRIGVLLLVLVGAVGAAGEGSGRAETYRVSPSITSTTFSRVIEGKFTPLVLVYYQGAPGWLGQGSRNKVTGGRSGETICELDSGQKGPLVFQLSGDAQTVTVQGKAFVLAESNVFLVRDAEKPAPRAEALGRFDLSAVAGRPLAKAAVQAYVPIADALELDEGGRR